MIGPFWTKFYFVLGPNIRWAFHRTIGPLVIAMLLQIFWRNFYSNTSCFSLLLLYLGNSQVSVYRTIGPTLVPGTQWFVLLSGLLRSKAFISTHTAKALITLGEWQHWSESLLGTQFELHRVKNSFQGFWSGLTQTVFYNHRSWL